MGSRRNRAGVARVLGVLLFVAVALGTALSAAPREARGADAATATFVDATGDAGVAPDLSTATVTQDGSGNLSFTVTAAGFTAPIPNGSWNGIDLYIDSDASPATGDDEGNEYYLRAAHEAGKPVEGYLFRSVDNAWQRVDGTSLTVTGDGDTVTLTVAASDIGVTGAFRFYVVTGARDALGNVERWDYSPDHGAWSFPAVAGETLTSSETALPAAPPTRSTALVIGSPATEPARPVAGQAFTVAFSLSVAGADATTAKAVAHARLGGAALHATTRVSGGSAVVTVRIPANATGRRLTVDLSASTPRAHATRSAVFDIGGRALASATTATTFTDASGDTPSGPDITSVAVSSTAAEIHFDVTLTGSLAIGTDGRIDVFVDVDQNVATGSSIGAEYDIDYTVGDPLADIWVWNGKAWSPSGIALADPLADGKTTSVVVERQDIGSPTALGFYVLARSFPPKGNKVLSRDDAPDAAWWQYALVPQTADQRVKPVVGALLFDPKGLVAGRTVSVAAAISRSDNGQPMTKGATGVRWEVFADVGETAVPAKKLTYRDGVLRFTLAVPRNGAGKRFGVAVLSGTCCQVGSRVTRGTVRR